MRRGRDLLLLTLHTSSDRKLPDAQRARFETEILQKLATVDTAPLDLSALGPAAGRAPEVIGRLTELTKLVYMV